MKFDNFIESCPILEQTADGYCVGRCWYHLDNGKICPRHGDVSKAVELNKTSGKLTLESIHKNETKSTPENYTWIERFLFSVGLLHLLHD